MATKTKKGQSAKKSSKETAVESDQVDGEAGNVDQIRDILFGNQMRDYDRRFQRMEEALRKQLSELGREIKEELERLRTQIRKDNEELRAALNQESEVRSEAIKDTVAELKKTANELSEQIHDVEAIHDQRAADLRDQILAQSKALSEDIQKREERLSTALADSTSELSETKMDRSALAQLLVDVAMHISDDSSDDNSD